MIKKWRNLRIYRDYGKANPNDIEKFEKNTIYAYQKPIKSLC